MTNSIGMVSDDAELRVSSADLPGAYRALASMVEEIDPEAERAYLEIVHRVEKAEFYLPELASGPVDVDLAQLFETLSGKLAAAELIYRQEMRGNRVGPRLDRARQAVKSLHDAVTTATRLREAEKSQQFRDRRQLREQERAARAVDPTEHRAPLARGVVKVGVKAGNAHYRNVGDPTRLDPTSPNFAAQIHTAPPEQLRALQDALRSQAGMHGAVADAQLAVAYATVTRQLELKTAAAVEAENYARNTHGVRPEDVQDQAAPDRVTYDPTPDRAKDQIDKLVEERENAPGPQPELKRDAERGHFTKAGAWAGLPPRRQGGIGAIPRAVRPFSALTNPAVRRQTPSDYDVAS